jgi:cytochrome c oxidase cbb3-type subunit 3
MTPFWNVFVIVVSIAMMIACLWLLFANARGTPGENTGHVWDDDLREYNNPLPRWWLNLFVLTVLFAAGYLAFYPGLGNLAGHLGWTSTGQMEADLARLTERRSAAFAAFKDKDLPALAQDASALSIGRAVYLGNCAGCHGTDAQGAIGFPNLADADWKFGGEPDAILHSIARGRIGQMPPMGAALTPEGLEALVSFVPFWSDSSLAPAVREAGMKQFMVTCAGCHGAEGKGLAVLGAPNLSDDIWLYGGGRDRVRAIIQNGVRGEMPAHETILTADEIRVVAAYLLSLSKPAATVAQAP